MNRTRLKVATMIAGLGLALAGAGGVHADSSGPSVDRKHAHSRPSVTKYATGLTNPRGLTFGPDGKLYVAEAGVGGTLTATGEPGCPIDFNVFRPYTAVFSVRVIRVRSNGKKEVVADNLPSTTEASGDSYGPTDLAFIGSTLFVLIEIVVCPHGLLELRIGERPRVHRRQQAAQGPDHHHHAKHVQG